MAKKSTIKNITGKIHLYLGLASGVVVFIVAITGCCWVFQEEILGLLEDDKTVQEEDRAFITPTKAKELAQKVMPGKHIHGTAYGQRTDPLEVIFYEPDPLFYQSVFLNPYSGEVLGTKNHRGGFFGFVLDGHLYLWLPRAIGSQVTSYGTMIFVLMLITGIILWWPKNKKGRRQRLKFVWKSTTRWRRKNFDLHAITGFYASLLALVLAFSGLIMAFDWIYFVTYKSWGGEKAPQFIIPNNISVATFDELEAELKPIDKLVPRLIAASPDYKSFEVHYPAADSAAIYVETSYQEGVHYSSDYRFYDQYTLEEIDTPGIYGKYEDAKLADKVIRMNYDIHVGAIGGIFGKVLAFIISLITASLPVTGFLLWWGRKNKKNDRSKVNKPAMSPEKIKRNQLAGQAALVNTHGLVRAWLTRFLFTGIFIMTPWPMTQADTIFGNVAEKNSQFVSRMIVPLPAFTICHSNKIK